MIFRRCLLAEFDMPMQVTAWFGLLFKAAGLPLE